MEKEGVFNSIKSKYDQYYQICNMKYNQIFNSIKYDANSIIIQNKK